MLFGQLHSKEESWIVQFISIPSLFAVSSERICSSLLLWITLRWPCAVNVAVNVELYVVQAPSYSSPCSCIHHSPTRSSPWLVGSGWWDATLTFWLKSIHWVLCDGCCLPKDKTAEHLSPCLCCPCTLSEKTDVCRCVTELSLTGLNSFSFNKFELNKKKNKDFTFIYNVVLCKLHFVT